MIPSFKEFQSRFRAGVTYAFSKELDFFGDPLEIYACWRDIKRASVLLESVRVGSPAGPKAGRYSIIAKDPFLIFESKGDRVSLTTFEASESFQRNPFGVLGDILEKSLI